MQNHWRVLGGAILLVGIFLGIPRLKGEKETIELGGKQSLPMVILIDQGKKEKSEIAIAISLLDSIRSGQFPILVSKSVLNRLLVMYQEKEKESPEGQKLLEDFYIKFKPYDGKNGWKLFDVNDGLFVLLVPAAFLSQDSGGLNVDKDGNSTHKNLKDITSSLEKEEWQFFQQLGEKQRSFSVDDLKYVFKEKIAFEEKDPVKALGIKYWNIILMGHGHANKVIAGLNPNDLKDLLSFFNTNINTAFLFVESCYAGGVNRIHFKKIAGEQISSSLNYLLVIQGVIDQAVFLPDNVTLFYETVLKLAESIDRGTGLNKLLRVLNIREKALHPSNHIPQVLLPGGIELQTFNVDEKVLSLGYVLTQKYALEQSPIIAKSKEAILVYPHEIFAPLIVEAQKISEKLWPLRFEGWENALVGFELLFDEEGEKREVRETKRANQFPAFDKFQSYVTLLTEEKNALYPKFISMQLDPALKLHWFNNIKVLASIGEASASEGIGIARGVLQFLRDAFFQEKGVAKVKAYPKFFINELIGPNDLSLFLELIRSKKRSNEDKSELESLLEETIGKEITLQKVFIDPSSASFAKFIFGDVVWEIKPNVRTIEPSPLMIKKSEEQALSEYIEWFEQQKKEIEALTDRPEESQKPLAEILKQAIKKQR